MNETLDRALRKLRLSGMRDTLELRVQEATGGQLNHMEFLELIVQDELQIRAQRLRDRRTKAASFREMRSLDDFDWSFNKSVRRKQIYDLATCRFIDEPRDVLFLGPPGTGKSFLCQALGQEAVKAGYVVLYRSIFDLVRDFMHDDAMAGQDKVLLRYLKPDLLIIDDMGMKRLPRHTGEYLLEVILRRHELRATIMTSNRPLDDWGKLMGDVPSATAILDRFLHHAEVIQITGRSYRLRNRAAPADKKAPAQACNDA